MMIQYVKIVNFEKIKEFQSELHLNTIVTGKNGTGKTAIARAIIWCLTGKDIDGQANATRYLGSEKGGTSVSVKVDGVVYERYRTKTKMTFAMDGEPAPDDAFLRKYNLNAESLLILFFPGFFLKMNEMKQREVFTACAPEVDEKALLKELLGDIDFTLTEPAKVAHKTFNDLKISYEKRLELLLGRATTANIPEPDLEKLSTLQNKRKELSSSLDSMAASIAAGENKEREYSRSILAKTQYDIVLKRREEIIAKNTENQKMRDEQKNEPEFREHQKKLNASFISASTTLEKIKAEGMRLKADLESVKNGQNCPTCGAKREIDAGVIAKIEDGLKKARADYVKAEETKNKTFEELNEINKICSEFVRVPNDEIVPEIPKMPVDVEFVDLEQIKAAKEEYKEIYDKINSILVEINGIETTKNIFELNKKKGQSDIDEIASLGKLLSRTGKIVAALHPKTGLPSIALKKRMENVSIPGFQIHFVEQLKNGEERECFHIAREDGIPLSYLSSGEQIKFCVALSQLMVSLTGTSFKSIFLERDDLVDCALSPEGFQVIREKVKEDGTVEVLNGN